MKQDERDMLIRIDERVHEVQKDVTELKAVSVSKDGFARCQVHTEHMANLDKSMGRVRKGIWGIASSMFLATMGLFYNMLK